MKHFRRITTILSLGLLFSPALVTAQSTLNVSMAVASSSVQVGQTVGVTITTKDSSGNNVATNNIVIEAKDSTGTVISSTAPRDSQGVLTVAFGPINTVGTYTLQARIAGTVYAGPQLPVVSSFGPQPTTSGSSAAATTGSSATVELPNPIACSDATCLIGQVVRYILGSIAVVATLMFVWGGVMMLTSGGNADQVKRAKETLVWAAIGVVVILLSWLIIKTVLQALTNTSS